MNRSALLAASAATLILFPGTPAAASDAQAIQDILDTSNDYLELVREYWPKIRLGDVQAMTVSYDALNNCHHFKDAISSAESIDDLDELLNGSHPSQIVFARGIYFRCRKLVNFYDEFPGWQDLRLRAALAGDIRSKMFMVYDFYRLRREAPRETFAFSPGGFLIESMQSGESMVFSSIGEMGVEYGIRQDRSETTSIAWLLISCNIRGDCGEPSSMHAFCAFMTPECANASNLYQILRNRAGSDEAFAEAEQKALDLTSKIQQRRYAELDLDIVW